LGPRGGKEDVPMSKRMAFGGGICDGDVGCGFEVGDGGAMVGAVLTLWQTSRLDLFISIYLRWSPHTTKW